MALIHPEDIEGLESPTEGERKVFGFLREAARNFASRFFGVSEEEVVAVGETYEPEVWEGKRFAPPRSGKDAGELFNEWVNAVEEK